MSKCLCGTKMERLWAYCPRCGKPFGATEIQTGVLDPALIWSKESFESRKAAFFQRSRGMYGRDGIYIDLLETNMTMQGCLGMPNSFKRREIRLYPGSKAEVDGWLKMISKARFEEYIFHPGPKRILDLKPVDYVPLPVPQTFESSQYVNLIEQAAPMMKAVEGLPCVVIDAPRDIAPHDAICVTLDLYDNDLDVRWVSSYAVMVGALTVPAWR